MDCPVCKGVNLVMSDRQGIEIDYCPQCRGVWLDRGELDKLIERASAESPPPLPPQRHAQPQPSQPPPRYDERGSDHYRHKKKKGLLGELFDF
ncbi:zf-TFIIB domain-containing protein [Lysobacter koreensis]|uniref:Zf-TFIIB domain-containing protein n=1 Tax=Lysobacter koreensis TaxID=266122 RepID=A0ABW2YRX9_9GAMM